MFLHPYQKFRICMSHRDKHTYEGIPHKRGVPRVYPVEAGGCSQVEPPCGAGETIEARAVIHRLHCLLCVDPLTSRYPSYPPSYSFPGTRVYLA